MSYASGGLIEATDYNGLAQTNSANVAWVWGTGFGDAGYGQSTTQIGTVSSGAVVTATQWQGLFNIINRSLGHQSGTAAQLAGGGNINVAGDTIQFFSNVSTAVTTINTNRGLFNAQGTTVTGTANVWPVFSTTTGALDRIVDVNVVFSTAQAARYFFNAGGQLNLVFTASSTTNNSRSNGLATLVNQIGGITAFRNTTNGGRTGAGGTYTGDTTIGYRDLVFGVETQIARASSGAPYGSDFAQVAVFTDDNTTTNGANGRTVIFRCRVNTAADDTFNTTATLTYTTRVDVVPPSTTYLTDVWGTPTITYDNT